MVKNSNILLTAKQARAIDLKAKDKFGISTLVLMENAGALVAEEAVGLLDKKKSVAIFCGKGNNGGDGFVAARRLLVRGIEPDIFLAARVNDVKDEARVNLDILLKFKQRIWEVKEGDLGLIRNRISRYNLIIDALLGVGLSGEVRGIYRDLIEIINSSQVHILSVDIPSGLDATTGKILGCCVKAGETITFVAQKLGMVINDGPQACGKVVVKDLGIQLL